MGTVAEPGQREGITVMPLDWPEAVNGMIFDGGFLEFPENVRAAYAKETMLATTDNARRPGLSSPKR
jgi:hypothetical protein